MCYFRDQDVCRKDRCPSEMILEECVYVRFWHLDCRAITSGVAGALLFPHALSFLSDQAFLLENKAS